MRRFTAAIGITLALGCSGEEPTSPDAGGTDGGRFVLDASFRDAGARDTGARDAGPTSDAGPTPDAGTPDAGMAPPPCAPLLDGAPDLEQYSALLECLRDTMAPEAEKRSAVDRFVATVERQEGFPIRTPTGAVFVYVRSARWDVEDDNFSTEDFSPARRAAPIRVAGEINMWALDIPMTDEGFDFFHADVTYDSTAFPRMQYKFVATDERSDPVWFSDPLSRRFDYDGNGRISIALGGAGQGHLEWIREVRATTLANDRTIYLYVPPGYDTTTERFAVLYTHDGNNLFDMAQPFSAPTSWELDAVFETEYAAGRIRGGIIVGIPNNSNRIDEYTHVTDDIGGGAIGGDGDAYAFFVAQELKPLIDARYRTLPDRANTGVFGSSLGGLISFHIGQLYPNVFRFVGGMSSTFLWGRFGGNGPSMVEVYEGIPDLGARDQIFYLDSGGGPGDGCDASGGTDNYCSTLDVRLALEMGGISIYPDDPDAVPLTPSDANIFHWWTPDAPHNESAWNDRVHRPLRFFFRQ